MSDLEHSIGARYQVCIIPKRVAIPLLNFTRYMKSLITALLFILFCLASLCASDWPQEAGPLRHNFTPEDPGPVSWSEDRPDIAWQAYAGLGQSPVSVVGDRVYVLGAWREDADLSDGITPKEMDVLQKDNRWLDSEGNHLKFSGSLVYQGAVYLQCFALKDGARIWTQRMTQNSYVSILYSDRTTPLVHNGRVYAHTFDGHLGCFDAETGERYWQHDLRDFGLSEIRGKGGNWCSPLLVDGDKIVVNYQCGDPDNPKGKYSLMVTAFSPSNGERIWSSKPLSGGFRTTKTSINVGVIDGVETIVVPNGRYVQGLRADSGEIAWVFDVRAELPNPHGIEYDKKPFSYFYTNRLPLISGNRVINQLWLWYGQKGSRTYCFEVKDGKATLVWDTPDVISWQGDHIVHEGIFYAFDARFDRFNRWAEKGPNHQVAPRRDGVRQFQAYDIDSGSLMWSSSDLSHYTPRPIHMLKKSPELKEQVAALPKNLNELPYRELETYWRNDLILEDNMNMYKGEAEYIIAGKTLIAWFLGNRLEIAHLLPQGGLKPLAEWHFEGTTRNPTTPVYAHGHLLLRALDHRQGIAGGEGNLIAINLAAD
ncbi:MAG: PQQ-binding-like beta-propeller repeat protein [Opitutales bacterium]|nr:PQQ-binding-like beta-propeller repeat protein [Opitutales bacterium]NRA26698.1 PQQ-like beta-propeller repeat protein [Opitutales bacterium]